MRALQLFVPVVLTVLLSAECTGDDARQAATPDAGGEQATATFSARPGTYELVCTYHESQGMTATLTVSE